MQQRTQWLIGGLLVLVALGVELAIYHHQRPPVTAHIREATVHTHYRQWQREYLSGHHEKFVQTAGNDQQKTLSEAQGYGMLITVLGEQQGLATHRTFDELTAYYLKHRLSAANPLMAWRQTKDHGIMSSAPAERNSATDGDLDIAYALILADEAWGSAGRVNYHRLAHQLIGAIKRYEMHPVTHLPQVGNWATTKQTRHLVRTSDLMTAHFRRFAKFTGDASWGQAARNSQRLLRQLSGQHATGLIPDFVTVKGTDLRVTPATPMQISSKMDNRYGANACRVPWRTAYDYQQSHSQVSRQVTLKLLRFFTKQPQIKAGYTLSGHPVVPTGNQAFTAPVTYAAQALSQETLSKRYAPQLRAPLEPDDYYSATLQMLLALMSANLGK